MTQKNVLRVAILGVLLITVLLMSTLSFAEEPVYKVLNPRGFMPEVKLMPLAPRPSDLNNKVVYLVTPNQKGSHIEVALAKVEEALKKRFPNVKIVNKFKPTSISPGITLVLASYVIRCPAFSTVTVLKRKSPKST